MKTQLWILLLIALIMLPVINPQSRPAAAQSTAQPTTEPAASSLLDLLTFVPNAITSASSSGLILSYADYRAAEKAVNVTHPARASDLSALTNDQRLRLLRAYARLMVGPSVQGLNTTIGEMPRLVGFEWFDTDQAILFGYPPSESVAYIGHYDVGKVDAALTARQFDKITIDNITVWTRFEDNSVHMDAVDPGDPFGGSLGKAARIAVVSNAGSGKQYLAEAARTPLIKAMLDAHSNTLTSRAFAPDYHALVDALIDPKAFPATPIQALFAAPSAVQIAGTPPNTTPLPPLGVLPPYTLAAIADYQDGDSQISGLAVLYTDPDAAEASQCRTG
jgi:hypothetical protein